jgi:hypothetical protein
MTPHLILAFATEEGIEFRAWMEPEPKPSDIFEEGHDPTYEEEHNTWLTSYQTFRAADKEQELRILDRLGGSFMKGPNDNNRDFKEWLSKGHPVTDIVEIRANNTWSKQCDWPRCMISDCEDENQCKHKERFVYLKEPRLFAVEGKQEVTDWQHSAICPSCNHPREVFTGVTGGFVPGEDQEDLWNDIIGEIGKPVGLAVLSRLKAKYLLITRKTK